MPDNRGNLTDPSAWRIYPKVQIRRFELTQALSLTPLQYIT